jgi:hypothetical protein
VEQSTKTRPQQQYGRFRQAIQTQALLLPGPVLTH